MKRNYLVWSEEFPKSIFFVRTESVLSQRAVKQKSSCLSPALSCVNFQNPVTGQHPNTQKWDFNSKPYFRNTLPDLLRKSHGFAWKKHEQSDLACNNTLEVQDGNRQLDQQKAQNCWWRLLHQELKPYDKTVFASEHDHSLADAIECQNSMKTSKNWYFVLCLFDFLISQRTGVKRITEHYGPRKQSRFSALQLLLMLWWLFIIHQNVSLTRSHKWASCRVRQTSVLTILYQFQLTEWQDSKKCWHFNRFNFMTKNGCRLQWWTQVKIHNEKNEALNQITVTRWLLKVGTRPPWPYIG